MATALDRRSALGAILGFGVVASGVLLAESSATAGSRMVSRSFRARSSDGLTIVGDVQGPAEAPAILFVHGLRQSRLIWDRQLADPALAGFRLVRFDLRGHGDSDKPEDAQRYRDLTRWGDDIDAVMKAAQVNRAVIVAWSLGGMVTGGYLRKHGGAAVAGLVLVDAVTKLSPDLLTLLSGQFAASTSSPDLATRTAATADFLLACFHRPPSAADLQRMMVINGMTARAVAEGLDDPLAADLDAAFADYRGPMLIAHGQRDRLVRLAMAQRMAALHPGARVSLYPEAGHSPFWEDSVRFDRELAAFAEASRRG